MRQSADSAGVSATDRFDAEAMPHLNDIFRTATRILGDKSRAEDVARVRVGAATGLGDRDRLRFERDRRRGGRRDGGQAQDGQAAEQGQTGGCSAHQFSLLC